MHELIQAKVAPPMWMGNQIRRDFLLARLDTALERRLTLDPRPGRLRQDQPSVAVAKPVRRRRSAHRVAHARARRFRPRAPDPICRAGARRREAARGRGGDDSERISADLPPRAAVSAIISRLARETRPVVLILDDFHRTDSQAVDEFVRSLIRLAPENCHFVVASRDYPWLGQSILAARGAADRAHGRGSEVHRRSRPRRCSPARMASSSGATMCAASSSAPRVGRSRCSLPRCR